MTIRERLGEYLENRSVLDLIMDGVAVLAFPIWAPLALIGFTAACLFAAIHHYVDALREVVPAKPCDHEFYGPWHDSHVICVACSAILPAEVCPECRGAKKYEVTPCPTCRDVGSVIKKEAP